MSIFLCSNPHTYICSYVCVYTPKIPNLEASVYLRSLLRYHKIGVAMYSYSYTKKFLLTILDIIIAMPTILCTLYHTTA